MDKKLVYQNFYETLDRIRILKDDIQNGVLSKSLNRERPEYDYFLLSVNSLEQAIRFLNLAGKFVDK